MKNTISYLYKGSAIVFMFFGFFGAMYFLANLVMEFFEEDTSKIADGYRYVLITITVFVLFCYWQYRELNIGFDFNSEKGGSAVNKIILKLSFVLFLFIFIVLCVGFYFPSWFGTLASQLRVFYNSLPPDSSFLFVLLDSSLSAGLLGGSFFALVMTFFRFGIFTAGLTFSIALHNFFNTGIFDLSVLINILLEATLSETWGLIVTAVQLIIPLLVSRLLD